MPKVTLENFKVTKKFQLVLNKTEKNILSNLSFGEHFWNNEQVFRVEDEVFHIIVAFNLLETKAEKYSLFDVYETTKQKSAQSYKFKKSYAIFVVYQEIKDNLNYLKRNVDDYIEYLINFGIDYCSVSTIREELVKDQEVLEEKVKELVATGKSAPIENKRNLAYDILEDISRTFNLGNIEGDKKRIAMGLRNMNKKLESKDFLPAEYQQFVTTLPHFQQWIKQKPEVLVELNEETAFLLVVWYSLDYLYQTFFWTGSQTKSVTQLLQWLEDFGSRYQDNLLYVKVAVFYIQEIEKKKTLRKYHIANFITTQRNNLEVLVEYFSQSFEQIKDFMTKEARALKENNLTFTLRTFVKRMLSYNVKEPATTTKRQHNSSQYPEAFIKQMKAKKIPAFLYAEHYKKYVGQ